MRRREGDKEGRGAIEMDVELSWFDSNLGKEDEERRQKEYKEAEMRSWRCGVGMSCRDSGTCGGMSSKSELESCPITMNYT